MDTTDEYVEMCRMAKELQKSHINISGDFHAFINFESIDVHVYPYGFRGKSSVWLPRQDQLQNMIEMDFPYVCWEFYHSIAIGGNTERFHSYEQLWLVFVMQKLYKKRWNGSEWDEI